MFKAPRAAGSDVLLVAMPWGSVAQPSLALGLLKAQLAESGIQADVVNLNVLFAELVGLETYEATKNRNVMASEWVFAEHLGMAGVKDGYLNYLRTRGASFDECRLWKQLRSRTGEYLERALDEVPWGEYKVVGFTTSMMQTVSSLAMARLVKQRYPGVCTVLGGANCEGVMGQTLLKCFDWVDVVVRGEPDAFVSTLFARLLAGESPGELPGVCYRQQGSPRANPLAEPFTGLARNPVPDYDDYFAQIATVDFQDRVDYLVMFESSRGCWWGERSHCTFCALNALGIAYRSKPVPQIVNELKSLRDRYGISNFGAADNIIDRHAIAPLTVRLAAELPDIKVFYDIRATVSREQMQAMHRAGIVELEAGLENLSTPLLRHMGKASTGITNVRFLRRCAEFRIGLLWNYLFGFPQERFEDYTDIGARIDPWLFHLHPPDVAFPVSLQRFAPYHTSPDRYGIEITGPIEDYRYIYGVSEEDLGDLAYYFQFRYLNGYDPEPTGAYMANIVARWRRAYFSGQAKLELQLVGDRALIRDTRRRGAQTYWLDAPTTLLYRLCESPVKAEHLAKALLRLAPAAYLQIGGRVASVLASLEERGLLFREGERWLAIAVPDTEEFWISLAETPTAARDASRLPMVP